MFNYETFTNLFVRVHLINILFQRKGLIFLLAYTIYFNKK